jgi:hypothetical protein
MVLEGWENIGSQQKQKHFNACDLRVEGNGSNSSQASATVIAT